MWKKGAAVGLGAALACWGVAASADTVVIAPMKDNSIYDESGALSNGQGPGLFAGRTNDSFHRRALLKFNVAAAIPPGSTITAAELRLYVSQANAAAVPVDLHRLLADWGEGTSVAPGNGGTGTAATAGDATWTHRIFSATPWTTPGGDYAAGPSATVTAAGIGSTASFSSAGVIADVQSWLDTPAQNHGWILIAQTPQVGQARRFDSREFPDAARRPALEVTFTASGTVGACCLPDGSCSTVLDPGSACGGSYQGVGTSCSSVSCPQPTGACCIANASATCLDVTAVGCGVAGGTFQGAFVACATDLCPVVPTPFLDPLPIPAVAQPTSGSPGGPASYDVSFVQFQQVLHSELPPTTVWGFDDGSGGAFPGPTFEASMGAPIDVNWINDLRDGSNQLLTSHHLPVDLCPMGATDDAKAVMHLHGLNVAAAFDGHPELTLLPGESAVYDYPNLQTNATLWYHDHSLGVTRLNVAMGLAGAYLLRDPQEAALGLPDQAYEIPMLITDRRFNADGSFRYPAAWTEHVLGNTILVNGRVWPYLDVDQGKYRLRWINASGSRAYRLKLSNGATFHQIGSDGGLLEAPVPVTEVLLLPGERADVVIDFAPYAAGTQIELLNDAPAPYPGPMSMDDIPNVMRFVVQPNAGHTAPLPAALQTVNLPTPGGPVRDFVLQREAGTCGGATWTINGLGFDDITEMPQLGSTEIWTFINRSGLAHPMHIHLVMFRVIDRQPFIVLDDQVVISGPPVPPLPTEQGYKDTVRVEPGEIVRVAVRFENFVGDYVYHCHILEHEDHEMMRQFQTFTTCGDGAMAIGLEGCDDGNYDPTDSCPDGSTGSCQPAFCGDGYIWSTDGGVETCDMGGEAMYCDDDCTVAACGDGNLNETSGEACDDGNGVDGDGCSAFCEIEDPGSGGAGGGSSPSTTSSAAGVGAGDGAGGGLGGAGGAGGADGGEVGSGCPCQAARVPRKTNDWWAFAVVGGLLAARRRRSPIPKLPS